jgi:hypothetical protein
MEYGCVCEEGNYPCSYCMKLAQEEIDRIDKEFKENQLLNREEGENG